MASNVVLVNALATAIGTDINTLMASRDLQQAALNTLQTSLAALEGTAVNAATVQGMINAGINQLVDGAPDALNTLNEIAQALAEDQAALDGILQALAKRVRVDAVQNFTEAEKSTGRANIGAASAADLGDVATANFVATYNTAKAA